MMSIQYRYDNLLMTHGAQKAKREDIVKFKYDKEGNVVSKLDEDGLETLYEYNLAGKLAKVSYADGKTVELGYNALKQLTDMKDWLGITKIELDKLSRATHITFTLPYLPENTESTLCDNQRPALLAANNEHLPKTLC